VLSDTEECIITGPGDLIVIKSHDGSSVEACLDNGVLQEVPGFIHAPESGEHWLLSCSIDRYYRRSKLQWTRVIVDTRPPVLSSRLLPEAVVLNGKSWIAPESTCALQARDELAGVAAIQARVNGVLHENPGNALDFRLPADGEIELLINAEDRVGNLSRETAKSFLVDAKPPRPSWNIEGPWNHNRKNPVLGGSSFIHWKWEDRESGKSGDLGGQWNEGRHLLSTQATDLVGNEASASLEIVADLNPPIINGKLLSKTFRGSEGRLFARPPLLLKISAEDAGSGINSIQMETTEDGKWVEVSSTLELPPDFRRIRAIDGVENAAILQTFWTLDETAPEIIIERVSGNFQVFSEDQLVLTRDSAIRIIARDASCGVAGIRYRMDTGQWRDLPGKIVFGYPDTDSLEVEAWDHLENRSVLRRRIRVVKGTGASR